MKTQPFQLTTLSQSSLQDYVDCMQRFKLRYLDRLSYPAVETEPTLENEKHQQEGEYFHRLVQQHLIGIPADQIAKYDLITVQNGKAIIYDWKTYRKRPRNEWLAARMQTRVYQALLVNAGAHLNHG